VQTYLNGGCSRRAESLVVDEKAIEAAAAHVDPAVLESLKCAPPKEQCKDSSPHFYRAVELTHEQLSRRHYAIAVTI
jgi:hypothetical protein